MGSRVVWSLVAGFLIAVFVRSFVALPMASAFFLILLALAALALSKLGELPRERTLVACVFLLAAAAGIVRTDAATLMGDPVLNAYIGKPVVLEGSVADEPDVRESGVHVTLAATAASTTVLASRVLVLLPPHTAIAYGDRVRVSGTLQLPEAFDTALGRSFDYPGYLAKDGIAYELAFAKLDAVEGNAGNAITKSALALKHGYLVGTDAAIAEPEAGLAAGITVGDKRGLGSELSDVFRTAGLVHVVVLSGYNITLVVYFVRMLLSPLPRALEFAGTSFAVVFFVVMAGGGASATRAGAMALIAVLAQRTGRVFDAPRVLAIVAAAMVAWNPLILAFDPSFQLSALATLGLVLFSGPVAGLLPWLTERYSLREIVSSTLATQLAVLPLLLYQNGQFSLVALPVNLLALIAVPYAMFASFFAALVGIVVPSLAIFAGIPAYLLLAYIIGVARFFSGLPFASVAIPAFPAWVMFAAYAVIFGAFVAHKKVAGMVPAKGANESSRSR